MDDNREEDQVKKQEQDTDHASSGAEVFCRVFQAFWFSQEFSIARAVIFFASSYFVLRYGYYENDRVLVGVFLVTAVGACVSRLCYIVFAATFLLLMIRGTYLTDGSFSLQWSGIHKVAGVPIRS
jgi:hypothetical protein